MGKNNWLQPIRRVSAREGIPRGYGYVATRRFGPGYWVAPIGLSFILRAVVWAYRRAKYPPRVGERVEVEKECAAYRELLRLQEPLVKFLHELRKRPIGEWPALSRILCRRLDRYSGEVEKLRRAHSD